MPQQLKIKAPHQASPIRQVFLMLVFVLPIFYLLGLVRRHTVLYFASPALNLGAHAMLLVFPVLWAILVTAGDIEFVQPPGELLKSAQFQGAWWQSFLFYPSFALAIFFTFDSARRILNGTTSQPATTPGQAAFTMLLAWIFALLLCLKAKTYKKVWILPEGLHIGLARFVRWDEIHHVRWQGHDVELYHKDCGGIPTVAVRISDGASIDALKQHLSKHDVRELTGVSRLLVLTQLAVATLSVTIFWFGLAAHFQHGIDVKVIVAVSLAMGVVAMWLLEKIYVPSSTRMKRPALVKES